MNLWVWATIVAVGIWTGIVWFAAYSTGYREGWRERHDRMIVSARSRQWADDNQIRP
jgi:hypothetical protein